MKKMSEQLQLLKEHLSSPNRWCKEYYAINKDGEETHSHGSDAVSWCMVGAMNYLEHEYKDTFSENDVFDFVHNYIGCSISTYNDTHTHQQVINMLEDATLKAKHLEKEDVA
jgi:hypothetical protein